MSNLISKQRSVLVVTHVRPVPAAAGNEIRVLKLLRWLRGQHYKVTLVLRTLEQYPISTGEREKLEAEVDNLYFVLDSEPAEPAGPNPYMERIRRLEAQDIASQTGIARIRDIQNSFFNERLAAVVGPLLEAGNFDVLIAEYIFMSRAALLAPAGTLKVIDTIDLFHSKKDKVCRYGFNDSLDLTVQEETYLASRADLLLAIQDEERKALQKVVPDSKVITLGFDVPPPQGRYREAQEPIVLIVASDNPFNIKGTEVFVKRSWPRIRAQVPSAKLRIAGKVGLTIETDDPSVCRLGYVPDLAAEYHDAWVVVNPTYAGTGLKIKTVEAISFGKPLVLWPNGAEGVPDEADSPCLQVASDWIEFSELVTNLLRDRTLRETLAAQAVHLAKSQLSSLCVFRDFKRFLDEHCPQPLHSPNPEGWEESAFFEAGNGSSSISPAVSIG